MAYIVYNNDGTILLNLSDGDIDQETTSLDLIGKNVNNYGDALNNNLVRLLTNFSNSTSPRSPRRGQLWFDTNFNQLRVFDGTAFKPVYVSEVSGTPPGTPSEGDFWYDSANQQFKVYNGGWKTIGPALPQYLGKFGIEPPPNSTNLLVRDYPSNNERAVSLIYSHGRVLGMLSTGTFQASVATTNYYFTGSNETYAGVVFGLNLPNDLKVFGDVTIKGDLTLEGNLLQVPRTYLTNYYDRTWIGSSITDAYTATNNHIRLEVLPYLYSTASTVTTLLSEVKMLTSYNTLTEVRHFRLQENVPGVRVWESYEAYATTGTPYFSVLGSTNTNVVKL